MSWNARALAHHDKHLRRRKIREVEGLCRDFDVVGLIEAHWNPVFLATMLEFCTRTHHLFISSFKNSDGHLMRE